MQTHYNSIEQIPRLPRDGSPSITFDTVRGTIARIQDNGPGHWLISETDTVNRSVLQHHVGVWNIAMTGPDAAINQGFAAWKEALKSLY